MLFKSFKTFKPINPPLTSPARTRGRDSGGLNEAQRLNDFNFLNNVGIIIAVLPASPAYTEHYAPNSRGCSGFCQKCHSDRRFLMSCLRRRSRRTAAWPLRTTSTYPPRHG